MSEVKKIYSDFYNVPYVFPLPAKGLAAHLAWKYTANKFAKDIRVIVPENYSPLMDHSIMAQNVALCPITRRDFGLDHAALNEAPGNVIYVRDAYGVASSYCQGAQGRFTIEDAMDSPFTPYVGTGDIFYTAIPGLDGFSVLMTHKKEIADFIDDIINLSGFDANSVVESIMLQQLQRKDEYLLSQINNAHTFLKLLNPSITTAAILCHYFSSIPLILPKPSDQLINLSNTGEYLYRLEKIPSGDPAIQNNGVLVTFLDRNLRTVASLAERVINYVNSDIKGTVDDA